MKQNREHFDLSEPQREDFKHGPNKTVVGQMKYDMQSLLTTQVLALNPKVYSINYQRLNKINEMQIQIKKHFKAYPKQ